MKPRHIFYSILTSLLIFSALLESKLFSTLFLGLGVFAQGAFWEGLLGYLDKMQEDART